ncbi:MAG: hypothetical protein GYB67_05955, partial [Chloroflexi bacterium]|nr:hypothetical protein [Chloroflexota bacterium]
GFVLGYRLIRWGGFSLYPLVEIGGQGAGFGVTPQETATTPVNGATPANRADQPTDPKGMGMGGFAVRGAVAVEIRLLLGRIQPLIGFQVGYALLPFHSGWQGEGFAADDLPPIKQRGAFFRWFAGLGLRDAAKLPERIDD